MKTLLVAIQEEDREQAAVIAAREFRVYIASSTRAALEMLGNGDIDGIVSGVHFNDGDVFEFLRLVRALPEAAAAALPFIVVKAAEGRLHEASYRAIEMACQEKGIPYLDGSELVRQLGVEAGHAELRNQIARLLG